MLTYEQAYNKIIEAYFKDEINPFLPSFCFCGTLNCNRASYWGSWSLKFDGIFYKSNDFQRMEVALLSEIGRVTEVDYLETNADFEIKIHPQYENALFAGMCAALDVLKQIHKERGEDVDNELVLIKRVLQPA